MKMLYVTTVGSTMGFFKSFIKELIDAGHTVDIASNLEISNVQECYREWGCELFQISTSRSPFSAGNLKAIGEIRRLVEKKEYDIVHCHTPIAAAATRVACIGARKRGLRVIYTAHGFHFYKGAPIKNWLIFFPIEKVCSYFTDVLITINREDFMLAQKKFPVKRVEYVPGVGIDVKRFFDLSIDRDVKRAELGVPAEAFLMCSVGELNFNKNHEIVLYAMDLLKYQNVHYIIAGVGDKEEHLRCLAKKLGLEDKIHLLGFRNDVAELYRASDLFVFPSFREGLPVSVMEAMAVGLPVMCSEIRGNTDLIDAAGGAYFNPHSVENCAKVLESLFKENLIEKGRYNSQKIQMFSSKVINDKMANIYGL